MKITALPLPDYSIAPSILLPISTMTTQWTGPRSEVMHHMIGNQNIGLVTVRQVTAGQFNHVTCSSVPVEMKTCSHDRGTNLFPLYLYPSVEDEKKPKSGLFEKDDPFEGKERIENFSPKFQAFVDTHYKHHYSPEEILGYIYAVLHNSTYRETISGLPENRLPTHSVREDPQDVRGIITLGWNSCKPICSRLFPTL